MRISRALVAMLAVAGMLATTATASARVAHVFTSNTTPAATRGPGEGVQQFTLTPFTIDCNEAHGVGQITGSPTQTLFNEVKYTKCTTFTLPVKFVTPIDYEYNAEGYATIVNTAALELSVGGIRCKLNIPDQTIPGELEEGTPKSVFYSVEQIPVLHEMKIFPTGFRERIVIHNRFRGISYSLSGGLCEGLEEKEHSDEGTGSGVFIDEITKLDGSLSWGPQE